MASLFVLLLALVGLATAQTSTYVELTSFLNTDCTGPVYLVRGLRTGERWMA